MLDQMIAMLQAGGYTEAELGEPDALGTHEYMIGAAAGKRMLTLGQGFAGEEGCYVVFYFTLDSGELVHHGSNHDEEIC